MINSPAKFIPPTLVPPLELVEHACKFDKLHVVLDSETTLDKYGCLSAFQQEATKMAVSYGMQAIVQYRVPYIYVELKAPH